MESFIMKVKLLAAAGVAIFAGVVYYFLNNRKKVQSQLPGTENERHHLTNVFSKAKEVAVGN